MWSGITFYFIINVFCFVFQKGLQKKTNKKKEREEEKKALILQKLKEVST